MSSTTIKYSLTLTVWGLALTATLSIANWPGDWGHSVCGIWGCGPPLQALVACHASWLVVLVPLATWMLRMLSVHWVKRVSLIGLALVTMCGLAIAGHEYLTWYVPASEFQRSYFLRRVGFVILTTVELPLFEIAGIAAVLLMGSFAPVQRRLLPASAGPIVARPGVTESKDAMIAAGRE